ncbi:hypothetical protein GN244_ATG03659 [Phytophthora infestans]|uniref:Uncharacterized protein n=1 Tax=Phytophthora infestans TaxID=4787 RepID=A0A833W623_PHYIN|nr:hypothetical protein GN244_ATG03659 [Phytophthora infestans]
MRDLAATLSQNDDDDQVSDLHTASVANGILALGLAIYNTRQWVSIYSDACCQMSESQYMHQLRSFVKNVEPKGTDKMPSVDLSVKVDSEEVLNESRTEKIFMTGRSSGTNCVSSNFVFLRQASKAFLRQASKAQRKAEKP